MTFGNAMSEVTVLIGEQAKTIAEVVAVAHDPKVKVLLSRRPQFRKKIAKGVAHLDELWRKGKPVYGVTTGLGDSCVRGVPLRLVPELSLQLSRFHGCGLGRHFDVPTTRAILLVRLVSLALGYSAVRMELLETIAALINEEVMPLIPEEGSVGASGDLTPLSYVAAVLMGEREVRRQGEILPAREALERAGIKPLSLGPKEGLAVMNGTSVMTAVACLAYDRADQLVRISSLLTAMNSLAMEGNKAHFDPRLFQWKPHPGQAQVARQIARALGKTGVAVRGADARLQDTYSLRCAPHVIGVLADALPWMKAQIEIEMNGANDNPLVDPDRGDVLHGGNFYGGHMAFVMDCMKTAVANVADLMDRQVALLVNDKRNRGLPLNLSGAQSRRLAVNHGFKAIQIACSAWAAEALKLTMPASVFSRSTESHNQDKVSMGTIAARDCVRVLELTEQVVVAALLAAAQALDLRHRQKRLKWAELSPELRKLHETVRRHSAPVEEDRPLEGDLRKMLELLREKQLV
jgi:histidine ammonia-lyase